MGRSHERIHQRRQHRAALKIMMAPQDEPQARPIPGDEPHFFFLPEKSRNS